MKSIRIENISISSFVSTGDIGLVFGAITDLMTGQDYKWDKTPVQQVIKDIERLKSTKYGTGWMFAGNQGLDHSEIYVRSSRRGRMYIGRNALADLLRDWTKGSELAT